VPSIGDVVDVAEAPPNNRTLVPTNDETEKETNPPISRRCRCVHVKSSKIDVSSLSPCPDNDKDMA
jgi:hypothetical protein